MIPDPTHTSIISTWQGRCFDPLNPRPEAIDIADIAHGLAHQCRFNGQTTRFYSVAQHSLMVADLVPARLRLAALLHDAAEAYLGDLIKPLKELFPAFAALEARVQTCIGQRLGVNLGVDPLIKRADLVALATEKRDLMPNSCERWAYLEGVAALPGRIKPMLPARAKQAFLDRFQDYRGPGLRDAA